MSANVKQCIIVSKYDYNILCTEWFEKLICINLRKFCEVNLFSVYSKNVKADFPYAIFKVMSAKKYHYYHDIQKVHS